MKKRKISKVILLARITGLLWSIFWILGLMASLYFEIVEEQKPLEFNEGFIIAAFVWLALIGTIIGWKREKIGGIIITFCAFVLSIFAYVTAGHSKFFASLISGAPFFIPGLLFLVGGKCRFDS